MHLVCCVFLALVLAVLGEVVCMDSVSCIVLVICSHNLHYGNIAFSYTLIWPHIKNKIMLLHIQYDLFIWIELQRCTV